MYYIGIIHECNTKRHAYSVTLGDLVQLKGISTSWKHLVVKLSNKQKCALGTARKGQQDFYYIKSISPLAHSQDRNRG